MRLSIPAVVLVAISLTGMTDARGARTYCPVDAPASSRLDTRDLVGLKTARARRVATSHDCVLRVVERNGKPLAVTQDYSESRVNVAVRDRRVRRVDGVY